MAKNIGRITLSNSRTGNMAVTATFVESTYLYYGDFEGYAAGDDPADWLDTGANSSMVGGDPGFVRNPSAGADGVWQMLLSIVS